MESNQSCEVGAPGSPIPTLRVLPSALFSSSERQVLEAGEWALAGTENDPMQTPALSPQTHLTPELFLISITFLPQSCSRSFLVKLERAGKGG